ncbi:MAG: sulfatase-like hydrolase/transferase [Elusimicrobiaceae bacterium]|nr:sulfatase-like hydrolase/transferase [Elusimicrobiaceae bacterium]
MHILLYQLVLTLFFALFFTAGRLAFLFTFATGLPLNADYLNALVAGLRFDLALCALPCGLIAALRLYGRERTVSAVAAAFGAASAFFILAEFPFYRECGSRLNLMFFKYIAWPHQLLTQLAGTMSLRVVLPVGALLWFAGKWSGEAARALKPRETSNRARALAWIAALAFALAWGRPAFTPLEPAAAFFCSVNLLNQAALNGPHNLVFKSAEKLLGEQYSKAPDSASDAATVSSYTGLCAGGFAPAVELTRGAQPNVAVIFLESVYTGHLQAGLMPNLSRRIKQGLYFSGYHSNVIGTMLGLTAALSSYAPPPQDIYNATGVTAPTVARYLGRAGYDSLFVYGKDGVFENMEGFLRRNGFSRFYDYKAYRESDPVWREIDDSLLFDKLDGFLRQARQPFFAAALTSANHVPYHVAAGFRGRPGESAVSRAVRFTDYALERFLARAENSPYYKNTVFIITADHAPHYLTGFTERDFNVPLLILSARLKRTGSDARICSAVDLPRSILRMCGADEPAAPFIGAGLEARAQYPAAYVSSVFYHGAVTPEGFFMRGNDEARGPALPLYAKGTAPLNYASAMFRTSARLAAAKDSRLLKNFLPGCMAGFPRPADKNIPENRHAAPEFKPPARQKP